MLEKKYTIHIILDMKALFKSPKEMQKLIDHFFEESKPTFLTDKEGKPLFNSKTGLPLYEINPPTLTGLALALGFCSRQSIYDYEKNDDYSYTIKKAKLRCENWIETNLFTGNIPAAAGIFALKNYGWKDIQDVNFGNELPININVNGIKT